MSTQTLTKESQTKNKSLNISKGQTTATKKPPSSGNPQVPTREATSATSATSAKSQFPIVKFNKRSLHRKA